MTEERIFSVACRLAVEFPGWTPEECWAAASRLISRVDLIAFEQSVLEDLAALPMVGAA